MLAQILGFFDANKGVNLVSKYWKTIAYENRDKKLKNLPQSIFFLQNDNVEKIKLLMLKNKDVKKNYIDATNKYVEIEDPSMSDKNKNIRKWDKKVYRRSKRTLGNLKKKTNINDSNKNDNKKIDNNKKNNINDNVKKVKWGSVESSSDQNDYIDDKNDDTIINNEIRKIGSIDDGEFTDVPLDAANDNAENESSEEVEEDITPRITIRSRTNNNDYERNEEDEIKYKKKERREINFVSKKFDNLDEDVVQNTQFNASSSFDSNNDNYEKDGQDSSKSKSPIKSKNGNNDSNNSVGKVKKLYKDEVGYDDAITEDDDDDDSYMNDYNHLLIHVKDIRSETQLTQLISYIQDGYISIEHSDNEKRKLKKIIRGMYSA